MQSVAIQFSLPHCQVKLIDFPRNDKVTKAYQRRAGVPISSYEIPPNFQKITCSLLLDPSPVIYRWTIDSSIHFLASKWFTLGSIYIPSNMNHTISTTTLPLILYLNIQHPYPISANHHIFYTSTFSRSRVIEPYSTYTLPSDSSYLFLTVGATYFFIKHTIIETIDLNSPPPPSFQEPFSVESIVLEDSPYDNISDDDDHQINNLIKSKMPNSPIVTIPVSPEIPTAPKITSETIDITFDSPASTVINSPASNPIDFADFSDVSSDFPNFSSLISSVINNLS